MKSNNLRNKFKLILYGNGISHSKWEKYELSDVAEYRGWLDYAKDVSGLKDVDIFLQLLKDSDVSRAGWPNKLGDYLAFAKPIILLNTGGENINSRLLKHVVNNTDLSV